MTLSLGLQRKEPVGELKPGGIVDLQFSFSGVTRDVVDRIGFKFSGTNMAVDNDDVSLSDIYNASVDPTIVDFKATLGPKGPYQANVSVMVDGQELATIEQTF